MIAMEDLQENIGVAEIEATEGMVGVLKSN
jgi:hypothetical protein